MLFIPRQFVASSPDCGEIGLCRRLALMLALVATIGLVSCAGGFANPAPPAFTISVSPPSAIIAAGSSTTFMAVFVPSLPAGGSLTWAVTGTPSPGTITSTGVYTASATPGDYTVIATWSPAKPGQGTVISASAAVEVIPPPQQNALANPTLTQASGAAQLFGTVQNAGIVGGSIPFAISTDPGGNIRVRSGFTIPVACQGAPSGCP
jgi:hypothetical protein